MRRNEQHHEQTLAVRFDHRLAENGRREEGPERNAERAAGQASQIKQRVWNLC